jgi:tetratricopeptide (TPR) repeat protein
MLPVSDPSTGQVYSREQVRRFLKISERQLRSWERQGLIPVREKFALNDLLALNTLLRLRQSRIAPATVRRAILALRTRVRSAADPLTQFRIYSEGNRIRVDIDGGTIEPVSGQILLDFGPADLKKLLSFPGGTASESAETAQRHKKRLEAELLFEKGLEMERTAAPIQDVIAVYEHALALDPDATGALVNLGTIYFNLRRFEKSEKYYQRALQADPQYALAHFNLGNLYDEQGRRELAVQHYLAALELNPQYGDAHYNLALLYQTTGDVLKAVRHWKLYLKIDPGSSWAAIARKELAKLKDATIVRGRA